MAEKLASGQITDEEAARLRDVHEQGRAVEREHSSLRDGGRRGGAGGGGMGGGREEEEEELREAAPPKP